MTSIPEPKRFEFSQMSTRVGALSTGEPFAFAPEALEQMASRINGGTFLPIHEEHLTYLPPIARMVAARVDQADDGALELVTTGETLPLAIFGDDPEPLPAVPSSMPATDAVPETFHISLEPRNFEPHVFSGLMTSAPVPLRTHSQWSALPPLEIMFILPVTAGIAAGLAAFFKSFGSELGTQSAKALSAWIVSVRNRAKEPERDLMLSARYELPNGAIIRGYMPAAVGQEVIETHLAAWADLSWFIEQIVQVEESEFKQASFVHDGQQWRLGWIVTTGEAVYVTQWFRDHAPNPLRFLTPDHRALLGQGDGALGDGEVLSRN